MNANVVTTVVDAEITPATLEQQILSEAADILVRDGWCQRDFGDSRGRHCVLGAMNIAARYRGNTGFHGAQKRMCDFINTAVGPCYISEWNDAPERTAAEVIQALRMAAL